MRPLIGMLCLLLACVAVVGCSKAPGAGGPPKSPEVDVVVPVRQRIVDTEEFPGRTRSPFTVQIIPRVSGYLDKVLFRDGAEVEQNQVLAIIDQRPFIAARDHARATLVQAKAHRDRLQADFGRADRLLGSGAMHREDYDKANGDYQEAIASVGVADADLVTAELNCTWTEVRRHSRDASAAARWIPAVLSAPTTRC